MVAEVLGVITAKVHRHNLEHGFFTVQGKRIYFFIKLGTGPFEYWYALRPDCQVEGEHDDRAVLDVRELPAKYLNERWPLTCSLLDQPRRSWGRLIRRQRENHALAIAAALVDGLDLEAHAAAMCDKRRAEWADQMAARALADDDEDDDVPF